MDLGFTFLVNRCWWVVRSRSWVVRSRGRSVFGLASVCNISDISTITIDTVSYSLDSAIGKGNSVASRGSISITSFGLAEVNSRVVILGSIGIVVDRGSIRVDRGRVTISWGRERGRWGSHSSGNKGSKSNNGLK